MQSESQHRPYGSPSSLWLDSGLSQVSMYAIKVDALASSPSPPAQKPNMCHDMQLLSSESGASWMNSPVPHHEQNGRTRSWTWKAERSRTGILNSRSKRKLA